MLARDDDKNISFDWECQNEKRAWANNLERSQFSR
jgi:hypothetical protein